ncbi:natural cytotoxicity triggering receptor 1-like isoform X1 [Notamacropus eugenii]|uniref:natural cytotoxicity triggering receptor 1-like isoform X1 n=1 Tax=Notamacropus eugenii TaxID=9315 RepID=UPI003B67A93E
MAPTLSALLCLGLCLSWRIWAQKHTLPRPTLRAEPGLVIPHGQPVSLWYKGPPGAVWYDLLKEDYYHMRRSAAGREAEFPISPVTAYTAGSYQCFYQIQSSRSEASKPLVQTVTGLYYSPSVSALPSSEVASGHNVTLLCHSEVLCDTYILYNDGDRNTQGKAHYHGRGALASFSMPAVTTALINATAFRVSGPMSGQPPVTPWCSGSQILLPRITLWATSCA